MCRQRTGETKGNSRDWSHILVRLPLLTRLRLCVPESASFRKARTEKTIVYSPFGDYGVHSDIQLIQFRRRCSLEIEPFKLNRQPFHLDVQKQETKWKTGEKRNEKKRREKIIGTPTKDSIARTIVHTAAGGYTERRNNYYNKYTYIHLFQS